MRWQAPRGRPSFQVITERRKHTMEGFSLFVNMPMESGLSFKMRGPSWQRPKNEPRLGATPVLRARLGIKKRCDPITTERLSTATRSFSTEMPQQTVNGNPTKESYEARCPLSVTFSGYVGWE